MNADTAYVKCPVQDLSQYSSEESGCSRISTLLNAHNCGMISFPQTRGTTLLYFSVQFHVTGLRCPEKTVYGIAIGRI